MRPLALVSGLQETTRINQTHRNRGGGAELPTRGSNVDASLVLYERENVVANERLPCLHTFIISSDGYIFFPSAGSYYSSLYMIFFVSFLFQFFISLD